MRCLQYAFVLGAGLTAGIMGSAHLAHAQTAEQVFSTKKTINLYIGYTPGGSYDLYGRMVAQHLGRHLPGKPNVVPNNMPGGMTQ